MKRQKETGNKNLTVAFIFCSFVFLLIIISVIIKMFFVVSQLRFDGEHNFNVLLLHKDNRFDVVSFSPNTKTASILKVQVKNKEKEMVKKLNISRLLQIPIDGVVDSTNVKQIVSFNENIDSSLGMILLNSRNLKTNLTFIDFFRLWILSKNIPSHEVKIKEITVSLPLNKEEEILIDKICSQIFIDNIMVEEKVSIQIINGTGVLGLGNRLAKFITNMGGNVVLVSTADEIIDNSEIDYFDEKTYSYKKLKQVLNFKENKMEKEGIADLIIIIGKNSLADLNF